MVGREPHVGNAHLEKAPSALVGVSQRRAQHLEALDGDGREETGLVAEVMGGRGVRHPGPASDVAQTDDGRALLADGTEGGRYERPAEIAVVVGATTSDRVPRRSTWSPW